MYVKHRLITDYISVAMAITTNIRITKAIGLR